MWALGVTGTYLGDYFGILMDAKVDGFPFNVTSAPMYWGSTMSFLGYSLLTGKVAGLILTAEVFVMYLIALQFEECVELPSGMKHANMMQSFHGTDLCEERHTTADEVDDQEHFEEEQELVSTEEIIQEYHERLAMIPRQINFAACCNRRMVERKRRN